jgi:hypothetical protein
LIIIKVIEILNKTQVNRWPLSGFRRVVAVQLAQNACKPINILPFGVLNNLNNKLSGQFPDPGEISGLKAVLDELSLIG